MSCLILSDLKHNDSWQRNLCQDILYYIHQTQNDHALSPRHQLSEFQMMCVDHLWVKVPKCCDLMLMSADLSSNAWVWLTAHRFARWLCIINFCVTVKEGMMIEPTWNLLNIDAPSQKSHSNIICSLASSQRSDKIKRVTCVQAANCKSTLKLVRGEVV